MQNVPHWFNLILHFIYNLTNIMITIQKPRHYQALGHRVPWSILLHKGPSVDPQKLVVQPWSCQFPGECRCWWWLSIHIPNPFNCPLAHNMSHFSALSWGNLDILVLKNITSCVASHLVQSMWYDNERVYSYAGSQQAHPIHQQSR